MTERTPRQSGPSLNARRSSVPPTAPECRDGPGPPHAEPRAARAPAPPPSPHAQRRLDDRAPRRDAGAGAAGAPHRPVDAVGGLRSRRAGRPPHRPGGGPRVADAQHAAPRDRARLPRDAAALRPRLRARPDEPVPARARRRRPRRAADRRPDPDRGRADGRRRDRPRARTAVPRPRPAGARLRRRLPPPDGSAPAARPVGRAGPRGPDDGRVLARRAARRRRGAGRDDPALPVRVRACDARATSAPGPG